MRRCGGQCGARGPVAGEAGEAHAFVACKGLTRDEGVGVRPVDPDGVPVPAGCFQQADGAQRDTETCPLEGAHKLTSGTRAHLRVVLGFRTLWGGNLRSLLRFFVTFASSLGFFVDEVRDAGELHLS